MITQIHTKWLGYIYTYFFCTINKDINCLATVKINDFKKHFNHNAWTSHQSKIYDICHKQHTHRSYLYIEIRIQKNTRNHQDPVWYSERYENTHNIHKRGETKHIGICTKNPEKHQINDHCPENGLVNGRRIQKDTTKIITKRICQHTRRYNNKDINQQNSPNRQHLWGKVSMKKSWFHSFYSFLF